MKQKKKKLPGCGVMFGTSTNFVILEAIRKGKRNPIPILNPSRIAFQVDLASGWTMTAALRKMAPKFRIPWVAALRARASQASSPLPNVRRLCSSEALDHAHRRPTDQSVVSSSSQCSNLILNHSPLGKFSPCCWIMSLLLWLGSNLETLLRML